MRTWDRKLVTATYSNYQFNFSGTSAWVVCDLRFGGIVRGDTITLNNIRINSLNLGRWQAEIYIDGHL
jgi:hypothetical protein